MKLEELRFRCLNEKCDNNKGFLLKFKDLDMKYITESHPDFGCPKCGRIICCGVGIRLRKEGYEYNENENEIDEGADFNEDGRW